MNSGQQHLVDAAWLAAHRGDRALVLIDTRPADDYWAGHLEGARHFDPFPFHYTDTTENKLKEFLSQLEWIFSALGISADESVIFYEKDAGMRAARGLWCLEYLGHPSVRMLDGGLNALADRNLVKTATPILPTKFKATARAETLASFDYVLNHLGSGEVRIFDVRSDEEYFGERVRAKRSGAIPGAIHLDWVHGLAPGGSFKPAAELRAMFEALGLKPGHEIITYCQGGYRAAHTYVALKRAGFERVRNYIGSWAEWGNREDLPLEHPRRRASAHPAR